MLALHEVLHLKVLVSEEEGVGGADLLRDVVVVEVVLLVLQPADYHVFHLELDSVDYADYALLDVPLALLPPLFD